MTTFLYPVIVAVVLLLHQVHSYVCNQRSFLTSSNFRRQSTLYSTFSSSSSSSSGEITSEIESIRCLDNRQLKSELKQLVVNLNGDVRSLNGIYDRIELEKLLIVYRLRYKQILENEKKIHDRRRAEEARSIQKEVKILDKIKSYQDIVNELRYYKIEFDPLDNRKNLITTLALARLGLLDNDDNDDKDNDHIDDIGNSDNSDNSKENTSNSSIPSSSSAASGSTWSTISSKTSKSSWNPFRDSSSDKANTSNKSSKNGATTNSRTDSSIPRPKIPEVKRDFPGSVLSQLANVSSLFEVDREVEKLKRNRQKLAQEKRITESIDSEYAEIEFGSNSEVEDNSEVESDSDSESDQLVVNDENENAIVSKSDITDIIKSENIPFKWTTNTSPNPVTPPSRPLSSKKLRPIRQPQPPPPSITRPRKTTRIEREEIASVDSVKLASELIMKSFLGPVVLATQAVLKPYLPRVWSWEGPRRVIQLFRATVLSVIMRLAVWATGDKQTASLLLFSTTTLCVVARKGIIWFVLSFLMVRTVRLALFSGGINWLSSVDDNDSGSGSGSRNVHSEGIENDDSKGIDNQSSTKSQTTATDDKTQPSINGTIT